VKFFTQRRWTNPSCGLSPVDTGTDKKEQKKLFLSVPLCSFVFQDSQAGVRPASTFVLVLVLARRAKDSEGGSGKFFPVHMLEQKKSGEKVVHLCVLVCFSVF
jgi:hypothetical protein